MIYTDSPDFYLTIPKINRCKLDGCNVYQLLLHNTYTKEVWMFKVRDSVFLKNFTLDINPVSETRFQFHMIFPEDMQHGTYEYYILPNGEWEAEDINVDVIDNSYTATDKSGVVNNGQFLVLGDKLLVLSSFEAKVVMNGLSVFLNENTALKHTTTSKDERLEGEIFKCLSIIQRGLIKYEIDTFLRGETKEFDNKVTYKEFKG